jgi:hypothetical protein
MHKELVSAAFSVDRFESRPVRKRTEQDAPNGALFAFYATPAVRQCSLLTAIVRLLLNDRLTPA